jgi:hypothetical protein
LTTEEYEDAKELLKPESCYNAGFVLAHKLSKELKPGDHLVILAPNGVIDELRNHGFKNINTLDKEEGCLCVD